MVGDAICGGSDMEMATPGATCGVHPQACPSPMGATPNGRRKSVKIDEVSSQVDGAEDEAQDEGEKWHCPSCGEIFTYIREYLIELQRQGAVELTLTVVFLWLAISCVRWMLGYLEAVLDMKLPTAAYWTDRFFGMVEAHPVSFLVLDFGLAIVIGWTFLYLDMVKSWVKQLQNQICWQGHYDYHALDEATLDSGKLDAESGTAVGAGRRDESPAAATTIKSPSLEEESKSEELQSEEEQKKQLRRLVDEIEEMEIKYRVQFKGALHTPAAKKALEELKEMQSRRDLLRMRSQVGSRTSSKTEASKAQASSSTSAVTRLLKSALLQVLARSANGICE